jgi:hypothetical protein
METSSKARGFGTVCAIIPHLASNIARISLPTEWHGLCAKGGVKNIAYTVQPKSGSFVNAQFRTMHHHAESRFGIVEIGLVCFVMAVLAGFTFLIIR